MCPRGAVPRQADLVGRCVVPEDLILKCQMGVCLIRAPGSFDFVDLFEVTSLFDKEILPQKESRVSGGDHGAALDGGHVVTTSPGEMGTVSA